MQCLLAAAAAATVLTIAAAASAQPYGPPVAPDAPWANAWRVKPYMAARLYQDDGERYGGARSDYGARRRYGSAVGPTRLSQDFGYRPGGADGYAASRPYGRWGARFTLPFRSRDRSHR
ncbi:hypothetical protein [Phenylobacterium sp.]|uniref:hypothetical protein n=2 Tax=unclassified Phenylobacterium TaxID=2640670 RepID=UPI0035C7EBA5